MDLISRNFNFLDISSLWLIPIIIWSFFWKGLALWNSAKNEEKYWFIIVLILNTVGILEIVYLFVFAKKKLNIRSLIARIKV